MAALPTVNPTYIDLVKMMAPDGTIDNIAEVLQNTYEGMDEMVMAEGNQTQGHQYTVRTGLPDVAWGRLYKGVQPSKGDSAQVTESSGFLESLSEVDKRLVKMAADPMKFRFNMDRPHIQAMTDEMYTTVFNGDFADVDKFVGLAPRFNDPSAANGANIINGGSSDGTADKTSIWIIGWGENSVFGFVPKGSQAGLEYEDAGEDWVTDANGGRYKIYRSYWKWSMGLAMPDWRYVVRIPNIRASELTDTGATGPNIPNLLFDGLERLPSDAFSTTRVAIYANRKVIATAKKQLTAATKGSTLQLRQVGPAGELSAKRKLFFDDIPVNRSDILGFTEPLISFS